MISAEWSAVLDFLRKRHETGTLTFFNDSTIANFVQSLPRQERISVLLSAYRQYRELGPPPHDDYYEGRERFEKYFYTAGRILIEKTIE